MTRKKLNKFGRRYPWEEWFSYDKFTLRRGKDYNGRTDTMVQQIRNAGSPLRHGVRVSIKVSDDGNSITVVVKERLR